MPKKCDPISEEVLKEYMQIDCLGTIDMCDFAAVKSYAFQNGLYKLQGWLSWNGDDHYKHLCKAFKLGFDPHWHDELEEKMEAVLKKAKAKKPVQEWPTAPKTYYVNKVRARIRKFGDS